MGLDRNLTGDVAKAHKAEHLAADSVQRLGCALLPTAGVGLAVEERNLSSDGKEQRHRMVRNLVIAIGPHVGDEHACCGGRLDVDVVVAGSRSSQDLALLKL